MFNLGAGEVILILVVALLVLGPKRLPELARGLGKFMREFRRQTDEVRSVVEREFYRMDQELDAPGPNPEPNILPVQAPRPPSALMAEATRPTNPALQPPASAAPVVSTGSIAPAATDSSSAVTEPPPGTVPSDGGPAQRAGSTGSPEGA